MRATRVRVRTAHHFAFTLLLLLLRCSRLLITNTTFCNIRITNQVYLVAKTSLFRDFFPLWVRIDPYTYRGASLKSTSHYDSTFTAKAKLIYQTLCLHISLSFVGQWLDGTATRRFCNSLKTAKRLSSTAKDYWRIATYYGVTSSVCCANP